MEQKCSIPGTLDKDSEFFGRAEVFLVGQGRPELADTLRVGVEDGGKSVPSGEFFAGCKRVADGVGLVNLPSHSRHRVGILVGDIGPRGVEDVLSQVVHRVHFVKGGHQAETAR